MTLTREEIIAMSKEQLRVEIGKREGYSWYESTDCAYFTKETAILPEGLVEVETPSAPRRHILLPCPDYPNDIAAAWGLVLDLQKSNVGFELYNCWITSIDGERWTYEVILYDPIGQSIGSEKIEAPTAPLAISRAWLIWSEESGE